MTDRLLGSVSIAATFTADPLLTSLSFVLKHVALPLEIHFAPYNQLFQQLLSGNELLLRNKQGVNVVLIRMEDFARAITDADAVQGVVSRATSELKEAFSSFASRTKVPTIVSILSASRESASEFRSELRSARDDLASCVRSLPGIVFLSEEDIDRVFSGQRYDAISDDLAHIPYTSGYYSSLALAVARKIHAALVPAQKVLVLDCDNTIWRGVVGEDGVDGIVISQAFASLQRFAVDAYRRGILICLASKNLERDVLEVFEKRSDMILKLDQIVAHQINWESKPQNVRALAQSLNLGLDSFVFLDDNPVECALMKAELPQVITLQLPPEGEIELFLSNIWTFDKMSITDEDVRRTQMYKENADRQRLEESSEDIGDFIASLEVMIDISPPVQAEWPRLSQLTQRTNQFNFSTIRRTEPELRALEDEGASILRVNVKDRFGDYGLVGLVIARYGTDQLLADTFLLSCRVLGRGVEHTMLRKLGELAQARDLASVTVPLVHTPKNEPARAFIESVARQYRRDEPGQTIFCIPAAETSAITHRPGFDPEEVINASRSVERTASSNDMPSATGRSERYAALAGQLATIGALDAAVKSQLVRARELPGDAVAPTTNEEHQMLALWEEILGVRGIGVEDDYFASGGSSLAAATMFAEISRRFGVKLPLTTIVTSPTVRLLSRHVGGARTHPAGGGLIELKPGMDRNMFFVHDGDGETLLYVNLARRLPDDVAVFGINPRSIRDIPLAHESIEKMADFYVERIRERQPQGPYLLGGMCAGGVIAYEMACQLVERGEIVELVAILDAATPQAARRVGRVAKQRLGRLSQLFVGPNEQIGFTRRMGRVVSAVLTKAVNTSRWEIANRFKIWSVRTRFALLRRILKRGDAWPAMITKLSVRQIYESAEANYIPKNACKANVILVRATHGEAGDTPYAEIYSDPTLGWGAVSPGLTIVDVRGGHFTMLQESAVEHLAQVLNASLVTDLSSQSVSDAVEELV
jgi:FkbH-like protein